MTTYKFPELDFGWLGNLPNVVRAQQAYAGGRAATEGLTDASPASLEAAGLKALQSGAQELGLNLLKQAQTQRYQGGLIGSGPGVGVDIAAELRDINAPRGSTPAAKPPPFTFNNMTYGETPSPAEAPRPYRPLETIDPSTIRRTGPMPLVPPPAPQAESPASFGSRFGAVYGNPPKDETRVQPGYPPQPPQPVQQAQQPVQQAQQPVQQQPVQQPVQQQQPEISPELQEAIDRRNQLSDLHARYTQRYRLTRNPADLSLLRGLQSEISQADAQVRGIQQHERAIQQDIIKQSNVDEQKRATYYVEEGDKAEKVLPSIDRLTAILNTPGFETGRGTETFKEGISFLPGLFGIAQSFGVPQNQIVSWREKFKKPLQYGAALTEFGAISHDLLMSFVGGSLGNQISNSDRDFIVAMVPRLGNSTEGNRTLLRYLSAVVKRNLEIKNLTAKYKTYVRENYKGIWKPGELDRIVSQYKEENPLFASKKDGKQILTPLGQEAESSLKGEISVYTDPKTGKQMRIIDRRTDPETGKVMIRRVPVERFY